MDGKTRICGLIANPVEHSMSPMMHNFFAERTGLNLAYVPFKVEEHRVEEAVKGAYALNILGLNVTVPHKQRVMKYLEELDQDAQAIGAVNTLVRITGGYKGYNTDGAGFGRALKEAGISAQGENCILIGAGGAAKAVAYMLAKGGAKQIFILNRNEDRAGELASYINKTAGRQVMKAFSLERWREIPHREKGYLAVQCTSVGMHPHVEDVVVDNPGFYELVHTGVDIVYTPARTRFMKMVEEAGGRAVNGLDMLLYQGVTAYELWNPQVKVDQETICLARRMIGDYLAQKQAGPEAGENMGPGGDAQAGPAAGENMGPGGDAQAGPEAGGNIILIGFMGAGKTSVGERFAARYGMPLIDTDREIEAAAGMAISEIFASRGEEAFRALETGVLKKLLERRSPAVISVGGGLPLREENRVLLKRLGTVVYLDVLPETVMERIGGNVSDRPMLHGDDVMGRIVSLLDSRKPHYLAASHLIVDVNGRDVDSIVEEIYVRALSGEKG